MAASRSENIGASRAGFITVSTSSPLLALMIGTAVGMDYALFIGWGNVVHGREEMSLRVFQETVEFWRRCEDDVRIDVIGVRIGRCHAPEITHLQGVG